MNIHRGQSYYFSTSPDTNFETDTHQNSLSRNLKGNNCFKVQHQTYEFAYRNLTFKERALALRTHQQIKCTKCDPR